MKCLADSLPSPLSEKQEGWAPDAGGQSQTLLSGSGSGPLERELIKKLMQDSFLRPPSTSELARKCFNYFPYKQPNRHSSLFQTHTKKFGLELVILNSATVSYYGPVTFNS